MTDRRAAADAPVVLVVEDEPLVRVCAVALLEGGFPAVEAAEAAEADEGLALARARPDVRVLVAG